MNIFITSGYSSKAVYHIYSWTPKKLPLLSLKNETFLFFTAVMRPEDADRMANSADPDPTASVQSELDQLYFLRP